METFSEGLLLDAVIASNVYGAGASTWSPFTLSYGSDWPLCIINCSAFCIILIHHIFLLSLSAMRWNLAPG